jgi:hypothetical protein
MNQAQIVKQQGDRDARLAAIETRKDSSIELSDPIAARNDASESNWLMRAAMASASSAGTKNPVCPSAITSGMPPTAVATTGLPKAIDTVVLSTQHTPEIDHKTLTEAVIERSVCDYAKERGLLVYKFTSPERAAVPDRMMITPKGTVFFVEFKREGVKATVPQMREHERLRAQGVTVFVVDSVEKGRAAVDLMML